MSLFVHEGTADDLDVSIWTVVAPSSVSVSALLSLRDCACENVCLSESVCIPPFGVRACVSRHCWVIGTLAIVANVGPVLTGLLGYKGF